MNYEAASRYLEDPQKYCTLITNLIEKADDEWQVVWKSVIPELFGSPEYNINSINSLLKVIEKAFKERTYHIRAQAFVCWQFFIEQVEKQSASDKLLNVILIPLSASNHSMKNVLDAKLQVNKRVTAWLKLLNTNILSKSLFREKGVPSLLKILYGPHTLRTASSFSDLLGICATLYRLIVQKCSKYDENDVILQYLEKALPILSVNKDTRSIGREIWIDVIENMSERKWPIAQFNFLLKTLENLLLTNSEQDRLFLSDLLTVLICEYNSFPLDHLMPQLSLLTRFLLTSASNELNLSTTLEYLMKKFRKKELILLDAMHKTLIQSSEKYDEQSQKCWTAVVTCFCKWNKNETDIDYCCWILLFPVKYFHEKWNSVIQDNMQKCFESMYSCCTANTFIKNISRELKTFLNNSENVSVSLLSATTCLCKIILQKSKRSDDVSIVKETLIIIHEKLPSQLTIEGVHCTLISKFLSCVLYFMEHYSDHNSEFKPIICKYSKCTDVDRDSKEYPVVHLISKYMNNKLKDDEKLGTDAVSPSKLTNRNFLAKLSPAENKLHNGSQLAARFISNPKLKNENTHKSQKFETKDAVEFIAIRSTPRNSPMTEHQKEMAKEKSYIPALYEDLSQSQSHSDSQSMLRVSEKFGTSPAETPKVEIIDENAVLPCSDVNGDSADEVPASLNFRDAIRSDKSSTMFASKKSLFNENASQIDSNNILKNATKSDDLNTKTSVPKRKSVRLESKTTDTTTVKRSRSFVQAVELENETIQSGTELSSIPQPVNKTPQPMSVRRKSVSTKVEKPLEVGDEQNKFQTATDAEFSNLFLLETNKKSSETTKVRSEVKPIRRKSLKSKNRSITPLRSPINTRKRKSLNTDGPVSLRKPTVLDINGSCSDTDEIVMNVKFERDENLKEVGEPEKTSESSLSSWIVTVISAESETKNLPELTDSVMIVDDSKTEDVITINSQSSITETKSQDVIPCSRNITEIVADEQTTISESALPEEDSTSHFEEHDQSSIESAKSTQTSFDLALTESENSRVSVDETDLPKKIAQIQEENIVDVGQETNKEPAQILDYCQNPENVDIITQKTDVMNDVSKQNNDTESEGNIDNGVSAVEETNANASPLSANSRTLQMLQMVYSGTPNLSRPQSRFKPNTRNSVPMTSPAGNRITVNGVGLRVVNSRNMKMLQVNSHVESPAKPSPNKLMNFSGKMEKFIYVPKECTSPSILKKPNLNITISPKSPKSVNFAEQLTDTREYQVDDGNFTDSAGSIGSQGSVNLLSDDEATSQETLYISLQNCNDDIRNIAERLTLNKEQLDTLRRMGIETVGQLASANTIIGKSIPVGDNRIQRLRNALQAYDDDRKLKGLRAPSVRRKITYKSPVEVSCIIEILDDEPGLKLESEPATKLLGPCEEFNPVVEDTTTDNVVVQPLCLPLITTKLTNSECVSSNEKIVSVLEKPPLSSPTRMTRLQTSPRKNIDAVHLSPSKPTALSSPVKFTRSSMISPTECNVEAIPSSLNNTTSKILSVKEPDSPIQSDIYLRRSSGKNLSMELTNCTAATNNVDEPSPTKKKCLSPEKSSIKTVEIRVISASPDVGISKPKACDAKIIEPETKKETRNVMEDDIFDSIVRTQEDELDFIRANNKPNVFTNKSRRTFSKLMGTRSSMTLLRTPEHSTCIVSSWKSSSPEIIELDSSTSMSVDNSSKKDNQESTDRTIADSLVEEQQSISIFSSEGTKCDEDVANAETESAPIVSDMVFMEDETLAIPSSSEIVKSVDKEPQISEGRECVFYALLQRMLAPYLGPSCLSKWSKESASREEIYKIIRFLDEGMEWIQSAGLMDFETRNFLNQLKYFKASD